jgi:hypothetical protein
VRPGTHVHKRQADDAHEAKSDSGSGANASVWAGMQAGQEWQYSSSDTCASAARGALVGGEQRAGVAHRHSVERG